MIVERDEILTTIKDRIAAADRGRGSLILLAGEAGAGKSSIAKEIAQRVGGTVTVVEGACDPLTTARPFGPFLEIASHPELHLGHLDTTGAPPAELFSELVDELARRPGPTLVVVEDLHWADDGTLDMIRFIGRRVDRTRAVVLATYRSDEVVGDHRLIPVLGQLAPMVSTRRIDVEPLSPAAIETLAAEAAIDVDAEAVHRRTGGNAFYVTELLAAAGDGVDGADRDKNPVSGVSVSGVSVSGVSVSGVSVSGVSVSGVSGGVPGSVQDAVMARVGALSAGAQRLVEAVAVSPRALEYDYAIALSGTDVAEIDEATTVGILSMERGRLGFRHELARLAVDRSTPPGRRRRYHRGLLDMLEADQVRDMPRLAHHAIELDDGELVVRYGSEAADIARRRGSNREARDYLGHVLRFADLVEPALATGWRLQLGTLHALLGDMAAAISVLDEAAADARRSGDATATSTALRLLSGAQRDVGRTTRARELAEQAVDVAADAKATGAHAQALTHAAFLAMLRRRSGEGIELAERAHHLATAIDDRVAAADAQHALACANLIGGDEDGAIEHLIRLEQEAASDGASSRRTRLAANLGSGCGEIRRYEQSRIWLDTARRLAIGLDMDQAAAYSSAWLARVAFETGRWDEVAGHVDDAISIAVAGGERSASYARVTALGALGRTRVRRGDPGGEQALVEAMELGVDHDFQYLWPVACGLAEHALWRGEPERGLKWLAPIHDKALDTDSTWGRGETAFWMWRLGAIDRPPASVAEPFRLALTGRWSEAADVWAQLGCRYEQGLALLDAGESDSVIRAIKIFDSLGARPAAQLGRQRLRELGDVAVPAMPRTSTAANPASLTNRQREVLELLVGGASNQDIADRLFLSKKTVEHHVSAVYAKLGVRDRPAAMIAGRKLTGGQDEQSTANV